MADSRKTFRARLLDAIRRASAEPGQFSCGYHQALLDVEAVLGHAAPHDMLGVWKDGKEGEARPAPSGAPKRTQVRMLRSALGNAAGTGAEKLTAPYRAD